MTERERLAALIYERVLAFVGEEGGWEYLDADEQAHELAILDIYITAIKEHPNGCGE